MLPEAGRRVVIIDGEAQVESNSIGTGLMRTSTAKPVELPARASWPAGGLRPNRAYMVRRCWKGRARPGLDAGGLAAYSSRLGIRCPTRLVGGHGRRC